MSHTNRRKNLYKNTKEYRINKEIKTDEVRVIGFDGDQLGIMKTKDALNLAYKISLENNGQDIDLVEISPNANPPVCKIMNFKKYLYEKNKKEKLNKKQSKAVKLKEIVIKPAIDIHDFEHKCKQARSFLEKGDKVKIMLRMSGREIQHAEENSKKIQAFIKNLEDICKIEQPIKKERSIFSAILVPLKN